MKKGQKMSEEQKRKISDAKKGKPRPEFTEEHKLNISKAMKNRQFSEEHKRKLSEVGKRRKLTDEEKRKISEAHKGRKHTAESRARMSAAQKGKKVSDETRAKMSKSAKGKQNFLGKKHTPEYKAKMSEVMKGNTNWVGRHHTEETKRKISEANKGKPPPASTIEAAKKHNTGRKFSDERRAEMSRMRKNRVFSAEHREKLAQAVADGRTGYKSAKHCHYENNGKIITFRSQWELLVAQYLDKQNLVWEYELGVLRIGDCVYLPDFTIFDSNNNPIRIVEVKGWYPEKARLKIAAFEEALPIPIEVWDRQVLESLGIL